VKSICKLLYLISQNIHFVTNTNVPQGPSNKHPFEHSIIYLASYSHDTCPWIMHSRKGERHQVWNQKDGSMAIIQIDLNPQVCPSGRRKNDGSFSPCCEPSSVQHLTKDAASVLQTCSEHVANEVTCNIQHQASFLHHPHMLRPCYDYVACNIQHQEPSLPSFLTQHPTLHVCNIETQHPQHLLNRSETLRCICRNKLE
jgi:hypothetical protein